MKDASQCASACQFIKPDYEALEAKVHGRHRDDHVEDERFFGVYRKMTRVRLRQPLANAQWTGITTRLAARMLETGMVEAILTVRPDPHDAWRPQPVLITDAADMAQCRGMRMGYAPLLALLEPARAAGYRRIAMIGIPCQVYALRALQQSLGFDEILVIGTPCSDNTTTEHFHEFLGLLDPEPEAISYLEFRADYRVEIRYHDGRKRHVPFLSLPISRLPADFFPVTCRTCVDYSNALADITIGYMGGDGEQWVLVRNERGERMAGLLAAEWVSSPAVDGGRRHGAVKGFLANVQRAAGGLPLRRTPRFLRPLVSWLMPRVGPRGLEFARARLEMKAVETIVHLRREYPRRLAWMVPAHVWKLVAAYGLFPEPGELQRQKLPPVPAIDKE